MQLSRRQIIAYVALAVVIVAVGVRYLVLPKDAGSSGAEAVVLAPVASPAASVAPAGTVASPAPAQDLVVYVCGAVRSPGVVRLAAGARVADALELAGGASGQAELAAVNLAALVTDGQQILVPERGGTAVAVDPAVEGTSVAPAGAPASGGLININAASLTELDALDGVGPSTAQKIIDYRTANGGFKSIDEIKNVPGIGDAKFAAMKDSIAV